MVGDIIIEKYSDEYFNNRTLHCYSCQFINWNNVEDKIILKFHVGGFLEIDDKKS